MRLQHYNAAARGGIGNAGAADAQALFERGRRGREPSFDEIEPLVLTMPEMLTESGFVSTCTCDEDTYRYGFLCNYYNQTEQHELSRGGAKELLVSLL